MLKKLLGLVSVIIVLSCTDVSFTSPEGATGMSAYETWLSLLEKGEYPDWTGGKSEADFMKFLSGRDGASAYEVWKTMISSGDVDDPHHPGKKWPVDRHTEQDFFYFITGAQGDPGLPGSNVTIENGYWYIDGENTGIKATGEDGSAGASAYEIWAELVKKGEMPDKNDPSQIWNKERFLLSDFWEYFKGNDGNDGVSTSPVITIENGYWYINGENTNVKAVGEDGSDGSAGASAYEIWVSKVKTGSLANPHPDAIGYEGKFWPTDKIALEDFWFYLRGEDGTTTNIYGSAYILQSDFVRTSLNGTGHDALTGDVIVAVYDSNYEPVATGTTITFSSSVYPSLASNRIYTVTDGKITIPQSDLLDFGTAQADRTGKAEITLADASKETSNIFVFPTRVRVTGNENAQWEPYNDVAQGLVRIKNNIRYQIEPFGSLMDVERVYTTQSYRQYYVQRKLYGADQRVLTLKFSDASGNEITYSEADAGEKALENAYYAYVDEFDSGNKESGGDFVARRQIVSDAYSQLYGYEFGPAYRTFTTGSYYVRTNNVESYFGLGSAIQSPVFEIPPMPRMPLLESLEYNTATSKYIVRFKSPTTSLTYTIVSYSLSGNVYVPYLADYGGLNLYIVSSKSNSDGTSVSFFSANLNSPEATGVLAIEVGCHILLSNGYNNNAPCFVNSSGASPVNQQPNFMPVLYGVVEKYNGQLRIAVSNDLGGGYLNIVEI